MITPNDIKELDKKIATEELIKKIDESIIKNHKLKLNYSNDYEEAIIEDEYNISIRNIIAEMYKSAGWKYVYHRTSSENNERGGLTHFLFSNEELKEPLIKNYHKI